MRTKIRVLVFVLLGLTCMSFVPSQDLLVQLQKRRFFWDGTERTLSDLLRRSRQEGSFDRGLCADWLISCWMHSKGLSADAAKDYFIGLLSTKTDAVVPPWWESLARDRIANVNQALATDDIRDAMRIAISSESHISVNQKSINLPRGFLDSASEIIVFGDNDVSAIIGVGVEQFVTDVYILSDDEDWMVSRRELFPTLSFEQPDTASEYGPCRLQMVRSSSPDLLLFFGVQDNKLFCAAYSLAERKRVVYFVQCFSLTGSPFSVDNGELQTASPEQIGQG